MRVLFWTDWYLPSIGGVEIFSARLLPALVRRGHEVLVIAGHHTGGLPDQTHVDGVTLRRFAFHPALAANDLERIAGLVMRTARIKKEFAPDLVHLNTLGPSVLFHLRSERRRRAPVLLTMHSPLMPEATRSDTLYGQALRAARWINCNSHAVHSDLCRLVPSFRERSSVTYYGMDPPALAPAARPRSAPVVLGFGRLVEDKGFDLAVRAFVPVLHRFPTARLVLAGEGAARTDLEALAAQLGVSGAVEFTGPLAPVEIPALINRSSLVVVPSRWDEPFGLVALEAALMARPVVAARAGGLVEVVEDGRTGVMVGKEDPVALAGAIMQLLGDPDRSDGMGEVARVRALERFGWERCVDEYEQLYERSVHGEHKV